MAKWNPRAIIPGNRLFVVHHFERDPKAEAAAVSKTLQNEEHSATAGSKTLVKDTPRCYRPIVMVEWQVQLPPIQALRPKSKPV
jgi:hypothetical protein